jgi:hypothetical protein
MALSGHASTPNGMAIRLNIAHGKRRAVEHDRDQHDAHHDP